MDRTIQPTIEKLPDIEILPVERSILPNGIPLTIVNSGEQSVVRIDFLFGGGYWTQSKKLQAYFTNAMLREGTAKYSAAEIAEKFDYYGSILDLSVFAQYSYITAYSLNKYFDKTTELLYSLITEPTFPENELNILVNTELQRFQINSTRVKFITMRQFRKALYGDEHPMGNTTNEEDYRLINIDLLHDYFDRHYNSGNCRIILSGKITDNILKQTEKVFGMKSFGKVQQKVTFPSFPIQTTSQKRIFIEKEDAQQSSIKMGMLSINLHHPDFLKFNVLITILGGYFGSRLMSNIREKKGYTYGIFSGFSHEPDSSPLIITSEASHEYVEPLIQEVYQEIDRLQNDLIGTDELCIVRNYMIGTICRTMETSFSVADVYQMQFINRLDDNFYEQTLDAIRTVTPEELRQLARRYLCKENLKEVISGKK
jgi:predicted Zn-dependent peptidase